MKKFLLLLILLISVSGLLFGQLTPFYHWTILPKTQMDEIVGEASGETALHHVIEMAGYQRNRPASEYSGTFREAKYVMDKMKEYGLEGATIERFQGGETWDGIRGELWEISPNKTKLADYDDIALSLVSGSAGTDTEAELVWVEEGMENDLAGLELEGKIAVTSGSPGQVLRLAAAKGVVGIISFGSPRAEKVPLAVPSNGIRDGNRSFAFNLPPREGYLLRDRLLRGEKIKVRAVVESATLKYDLQVPACVIPGTKPETEEIIFSAHIFEGYAKQGANDNISGSAVILEIARTLHDLYMEGRLPRPERSIRFIWVPEFSGTIPWVKKHQDLMDKTLCNINLDMVGINLKENNSFMCLMRTTYANPHYINDVMENLYTWMGESNREIISNRSQSLLTNRIVAPSGSDDPFYHQIDQHYGASDHEVFNDWSVQVPGVMMITWPDLYYHTSEDLPNKLDPTQLKRTAIIGAAAAHTIAMADEKMAAKIAGEVFSNSGKRIGHQLARALAELNASSGKQTPELVKKTRGYLDATFLNEKATILSISELAPGNAKLHTTLDYLVSQLERIYQSNIQVFDGFAEIRVTPDSLTDLERKAQNLIPKPTGKVKKSGYGAARKVGELPETTLQKYPYRNIASTDELAKLINGKNNLLDIKKMLDTQYKEESDLQAIFNFVSLLNEGGLIGF